MTGASGRGKKRTALETEATRLHGGVGRAAVGGVIQAAARRVNATYGVGPKYDPQITPITPIESV
jgi:hypothetical protein